MNMPKKEIREWIVALRSGKYKQTKGILQDENGFCCLGVACKLFSPEHPRKEFNLVGSLPEPYDYDPEWLVMINTDFELKTSKHLSDLNDTLNFTFDEIADVLQAVYILEVLK